MAMACNKSFSGNYMLLTPEDASFFDLVRILFSSDVGKRKSVDIPRGRRAESGELRLMAAFVGLLWNFLRGKVVIPDKNSATYLSFIGSLDIRVELDKNIKHGDSRYYAALSMMAAKASYENRAYLETTVRDQWKMEFLGSFDFWNEYQEKATTQAFMLRDKTVNPELVVVAFRGTESFDADAWCTDFDMSWYEHSGMGKVHAGFMKALGLQKNARWPKNLQQADDHPAVAYYHIRDLLKELLQASDREKFILTGHSLGGALAILFPAILAFHGEEWLLERLEGVYTFGQPRVGDEKFGKFYEGTFFKHFGTCIYFDSFYNGKVVAEEPNKNYFSPFTMIPRTINAIWELMIRSFTIAYRWGPDYVEGGTLRVLRLIGLLCNRRVIAGISAHSPQDYVNSTRLASSDVYLQGQNPKHD
ncbi:alpha/beta-Hydrolases superfamily protein [Actinidia rufa]|uniref:Alpha/beta-Hydrolases superfamily protein n=1 Tax=Actinidia rufa TaxID=165716 RepID=A0A7J0DFH5_9ERIC|nr:alpha/beta-Hydrolases superfamily protein [Actinidia rufa]